jgi:hypothetical protein
MMSHQHQMGTSQASVNGFPNQKLDRKGSGQHENSSHLMKSLSGGFSSTGEHPTSQFMVCVQELLLTMVYSGLENGGKSGQTSPSRDRLIYVLTQLIGHHVDVHVKSGSVISGIFHATNSDKDFGTLLSFV